MAIFYPRKQTVIIFVLCLIAVIATAYYAYGGQAISQNPAKNIVAQAQTVSAAEPISTDTSWKKQFFDSSATSSYKAAQKQTVSKNSPENLTDTDLLGRQFFSKYVELQQAGLTNDPQAVSDANDQLIADSVAKIEPPTPRDLTSIHISTAIDARTLQIYGSEIVTILTTYIPDQDHNEAVVAVDAFDRGDMGILKNIDPIISNYKDAVTALLAMNVPRPLAQYHLDLVNGVSIALFNAQKLRNSDTDPLNGLGAIGLEMTGLQTMNDALNNIKQYFINAGIPFRTQ